MWGAPLQAAGVAREHEMQSVIIVIYLMVVMAMIAVILLQKSEGGGLGMGGGGAGGFLSSRGTSNVLTRTTAFLALGFFGLSLLLSILSGVANKPKSFLPSAPAPTQQQEPLRPLELPGSLTGGGQPASPPPPPAGGAPQVPRSQ
jgi:preprotein translocase subunit SecG